MHVIWIVFSFFVWWYLRFCGCRDHVCCVIWFLFVLIWIFFRFCMGCFGQFERWCLCHQRKDQFSGTHRKEEDVWGYHVAGEGGSDYTHQTRSHWVWDHSRDTEDCVRQLESTYEWSTTHSSEGRHQGHIVSRQALGWSGVAGDSAISLQALAKSFWPTQEPITSFSSRLQSDHLVLL